jgi:hypothetical protein
MDTKKSPDAVSVDIEDDKIYNIYPIFRPTSTLLSSQWDSSDGTDTFLNYFDWTEPSRVEYLEKLWGLRSILRDEKDSDKFVVAAWQYLVRWFVLVTHLEEIRNVCPLKTIPVFKWRLVVPTDYPRIPVKLYPIYSNGGRDSMKIYEQLRSAVTLLPTASQPLPIAFKSDVIRLETIAAAYSFVFTLINQTLPSDREGIVDTEWRENLSRAYTVLRFLVKSNVDAWSLKEVDHENLTPENPIAETADFSVTGCSAWMSLVLTRYKLYSLIESNVVFGWITDNIELMMSGGFVSTQTKQERRSRGASIFYVLDDLAVLCRSTLDVLNDYHNYTPCLQHSGLMVARQEMQAILWVCDAHILALSHILSVSSLSLPEIAKTIKNMYHEYEESQWTPINALIQNHWLTLFKLCTQISPDPPPPSGYLEMITNAVQKVQISVSKPFNMIETREKVDNAFGHLKGASHTHVPKERDLFAVIFTNEDIERLKGQLTTKSQTTS